MVVTVPADQTSTEGATITLAVSAKALSGTLTYSASGLPDGLSINSSSGVITGTISPSDAADGPFTPTVVATNGSFSSSQTFNWTVNPRISITAIPDQTGIEY